MTSRIRSLVHTIYDMHLTLGPGRTMALARSTRTDHHVVILTPSSVGNLGDEAMVATAKVTIDDKVQLISENQSV